MKIDRSKPTYPLPPYISGAEQTLQNIVDDFGNSIPACKLEHSSYMARYYSFRGDF